MTICTIAAPEAKQLIDQGATLIDIREADEHAREHIARARNLSLSALTLLEGTSDPIIFHCRTGKRTATSASQLEAAAGQRKAYILAGGLDGWKTAGLSTVTDASAPIEIFRQVQIAAGSLVVLGVLLGSLVAPQLYALSAIVASGLIFSGISGWCGMAELLSLMPWNRKQAL
jgi:rhodanese-related sulfurtransferase